MSVSPLTRRAQPYTTTPYDRTVERICARYRLNYYEVSQLNPQTAPLTAGDHEIAADVTLNLPIPDELFEYEWEDVTLPPRTTLGNAPHTRPPFRDAHGAPDPTAQYLWDCILNCEFRNHHYRAYAYEPNVDEIHIPEEVVVMVPWPARVVGPPLRMAPTPTTGSESNEGDEGSGESTPTTRAARPGWVTRLWRDFIVPLRRHVRSLQGANRQYWVYVQFYQRDLGILQLVDTVIAVIGRIGGHNMDALQQEVHTVMNAFAEATPQEWTVRMPSGRLLRTPARTYLRDRIKGRLTDSDFNDLCVQAFTEEDVRLNETETIREAICGTLADALCQLSLGGGEAWTERQIGDALDAHLGDSSTPNDTPVRGANAIQTVMSMAQSTQGRSSPPSGGEIPRTRTRATSDRALGAVESVRSLLTTMVGTLPGPSSLAGALIQLEVFRLTSSLRRLIFRGTNRSAGDTALMRRRLAQVARLSGRPENEVFHNATFGDGAAEEALADDLERIMGGRGWCSAIALASVAGLLHAALNPPGDVFDPDPESTWVHYVSGIAGDSINAVSGFANAVHQFGTGSAGFRILRGLGHLGAAIGVMTSAYDFVRCVQNGDTVGAILAAAAVAGGLMLFVPGPVGAVGAAIVGTTAIVTEVYQSMRDAPNSRRVVLSLIEQFKTRPLMRIAAEQESGCVTAVNRLAEMVAESDAFVEMRHNQSSGRRWRSILTELDIDESIISSGITFSLHMRDDLPTGRCDGVNRGTAPQADIPPQEQYDGYFNEPEGS